MTRFNNSALWTWFIGIILCSRPAFGENQTISLKQTLDLAVQSPEVKSAQAMANAADENHKADWRKIYMPKLGAGFGYSRLLQDQGISFPAVATPLGALNVPPVALKQDSLVGTIGLIQPIFDPEHMLYSAAASKNLAEAERLRSSRQVKETQGRSVSYYLQILELRAKRTALEKSVRNLRSRQPEIKRLYELGHVSESDTLKIKLGIDDANQGIRELLQKEEFLGQLLANLLGERKVLSPEDLDDELPDVVLSKESVDPMNREDIKSIDRQLEALDYSKAASRASYLPKVAAFASHIYLDSGYLLRKNSDSVGVILTWSIFDGGAGLANANATAEKRQSLEHKKSLAIDSIQASYIDAANTLKIKKQEFQERKSSIENARQVVDLEFGRLKSGKTTVNNLIDAEDVLKDRMEKAILSKIGWYQAWFGGQVASGAEIRVP